MPTKNEKKLSTVRLAMYGLADVVDGIGNPVWAEPVDSGESREPWSPEEAIGCTRERMEDAREKICGARLAELKQRLEGDGVGHVLEVAIESFVDLRGFDESKEDPFEYAFVGVRHTGTGKVVGRFSSGCQFPRWSVEEALREKTTPGKRMSAHDARVLHDNPHPFLCGRSRYELIGEALGEAIAEALCSR